jgi:Glutaredoxin-like domain (DUF836)
LSEFVIRFLTRPGCQLCDDARPLVEDLVGRRGGVILELDIEQNEQLTSEFGMRIPVVLLADGSVVAEGLITRKELRKGLRRAKQ